jgi:hypothetical protein
MNKKLMAGGVLVILIGALAFFLYNPQTVTPTAIEETTPTPIETTSSEPVLTTPTDPQLTYAYSLKEGDRAGLFTVSSIRVIDPKLDSEWNLEIRFLGTATVTGTYETNAEYVTRPRLEKIDAVDAAKMPMRYTNQTFNSLCVGNNDQELAALLAVEEAKGLKEGDRARMTVDSIVHRYYPSGGCARTAHVTAIEKL